MNKIGFIFFLIASIVVINFHSPVHADNPPIRANSPMGNYLELSGGHIKANGSGLINPKTVELNLWIKPTSVSGIQSLIFVGQQNSTQPNYELSINGGSLSLRFTNSTGSTVLITAGAVPQNSWSRVAAIISKGATRLFINDTTVFTYSGASNLLPIGPDILVGKSFIGNMDEVGIYASPGDVFIDIDTQLFWHLDESRGETVAHDSSGYGRDGVLIGGDSAIHFFGVLPTPTPMPGFSLPILRSIHPNFPPLTIPTLAPLPNAPTNPHESILPKPTSVQEGLRLSRPSRPILSIPGR